MAMVRLGAAGLLMVVVLMMGAACAAAPGPSPTMTAVKPTAAPAKPAENTTPAAKPAASADWKAEWDRTVAAARREGRVAVAGGRGEPYRLAALEFQKVYPDIQVEFAGVQGTEFGPKILAEREGGQYLWDVHFGGANTAFSVLIPKGVVDPLTPALMLPEVLDSGKWLGGLSQGFVDKGRQNVFAFEARLTYSMYINRDAVAESELSQPDQLLDPKWRGKIIAQDPRRTGSAGQHVGLMLSAKGEDWLRKFLAQDLTIVNEGRQQIEALVRGRFSVAMAVNAADIEQYRREGLAANLKPLDPNNPAVVAVTSGFGNLMLVNRAPHPNAAKVFVNWLLSKEGQQAYVEATGLNSRRLDVTGPAETAPKSNLTNLASEEFQPNIERALNIAKDVIK